MSLNENPSIHEASGDELKIPVDQQTSGAVPDQHLATHQQPKVTGNTQQSATPLSLHQHAASSDATEQSPAHPITRHYHTASLESIRQPLPPYPTYQHLPFHGNPYPYPQAGAHYSAPDFSMPPYPIQSPHAYPPLSYERQPISVPFQPSQPALYYNNIEGTSRLENQQPEPHHFHSRSDPLLNQGTYGAERPSTPPMDFAGRSNPYQSVPEPLNLRTPPTQQPAVSLDQPPTPTSDPLQYAQGLSPNQGNAFKSPRVRTMKHLTCWYWARLGNCRNGDRCYYSHTFEGTDGVADKPVHKEPGSTLASIILSRLLTPVIPEPAVAGKNAQKQRPAYIDWDLMHKVDDPPQPKSPLPPNIQAQIALLYEKHTPAVSLEPRLQRLQEVEQRAFTERASEAAGAAAHHARLDERMTALNELIERLERNNTTTAGTARTESTASTMEFSGDPTSAPQETKAIKLETDTTTTTAATTASVMTDLTAENQALRKAVHDMANVVSTVMSNNVDLRVQRNQLHDSLFHKILKLPVEYQDVLLKPFANSTDGVQVSRLAGEQARTAMYNIRAKLIEMGCGGLLTAWDRDYCSSSGRTFYRTTGGET
ncbi:MAG: hypothetical protein Q9204_007069 [Flavoplaca sp. TL-2023a]